jgi:hypothetical protein
LHNFGQTIHSGQPCKKEKIKGKNRKKQKKQMGTAGVKEIQVLLGRR